MIFEKFGVHYIDAKIARELLKIASGEKGAEAKEGPKPEPAPTSPPTPAPAPKKDETPKPAPPAHKNPPAPPVHKKAQSHVMVPLTAGPVKPAGKAPAAPVPPSPFVDKDKGPIVPTISHKQQEVKALEAKISKLDKEIKKIEKKLNNFMWFGWIRRRVATESYYDIKVTDKINNQIKLAHLLSPKMDKKILEALEKTKQWLSVDPDHSRTWNRSLKGFPAYDSTRNVTRIRNRKVQDLGNELISKAKGGK